MTRTTVYKFTIWSHELGTSVSPPSGAMGTDEFIQAHGAKKIEGSGIEVDRSELTANGLYYPKAHKEGDK